MFDTVIKGMTRGMDLESPQGRKHQTRIKKRGLSLRRKLSNQMLNMTQELLIR